MISRHHAIQPCRAPAFCRSSRRCFACAGCSCWCLPDFSLLVGVVAFQIKLFVLDLDIWWHLKVGDWIVQHAAFPHTGILSRTAATRPWIAYSWGFEVLLSRFYAWFGLVGIGLYGTLLTLAVAFSVYWMVRRLSGSFWMSCVLAAISATRFSS